MKNLPKKIYLQIGGSDATTDWNDLFHGAITWADHKVNDNDIEFVLSDVVWQSEQFVCSCGKEKEADHIMCYDCWKSTQ